ncbi:hybrid sensor histidine kinase/response regulator [Polaromonas sp. CT11-55]|uniref:ATP-binding response regulator n=1 Tax=Polaromonas sp. CT11-55 TaxID=3243045 RepID=UPI0039A515BC
MHKLLAESRVRATCKRYQRGVYLVLLGLAGPLVIAVTPDSQHIFWSAILLVVAAASCIESGLEEFPYGPVLAILPLLIAATVAWSSATPWLLVLIVVAMASYWRIRVKHRKTMRPLGIAAPEAQHVARQDERRAMQLLAAASHDLRQPVQALVAQVNLMGGNPAYINPQRFKDVQTSVNTLAEMLNDLLDVNRINLGLYEARPQPVNVRLLLQEVEQVFAANASTKGLRLLVECTEDVWIKSDLKLLRRIVFNLVVNAIRYTDVGGIQLSCLVVEGRALLQAEDTGKGMNVEDFPGKSTTFERRPTASHQGLGLGLAIVSTMALQLGHTLRVVSELGEGTQIEVDLGERISAPSAAEQAGNAAPSVLAGTLIAIVEDDAAVRQSLANTLESWGCRTVSADSGQGLQAQLRHLGAPPALVITDFNLRAKETGLDVIRALRKTSHGARIPAILLTGDLVADVQEGATLADVRVLYKPVRPSDLRKIVNELVFANQRQA